MNKIILVLLLLVLVLLLLLIFKSKKKVLVTIIIILSLSILYILYSICKKTKYSIKTNFISKYSYDPEPVILEKFLSDEEIEYIKSQATSFTVSQTLADKEGYPSTNRKSETCWLNHNTDPYIKKILQRGCDLTSMPLENCEHLQVVRYGPGGFFGPHYDSASDDSEVSVEFRTHGGNRVLTILIILSDPSEYEGGETMFTILDKKFKVNKGDAILFYSLDPEGKENVLSQHSGSEIKSGEKMIANIWIRQNKFV